MLEEVEEHEKRLLARLPALSHAVLPRGLVGLISLDHCYLPQSFADIEPLIHQVAIDVRSNQRWAIPLGLDWASNEFVPAFKVYLANPDPQEGAADQMDALNQDESSGQNAIAQQMAISRVTD